MSNLLADRGTEMSSWAPWLLLVADLGILAVLAKLFFRPAAPVPAEKPTVPRRHDEILSLQRLAQIVQRGQTSTQVYRVLLESAVQTVRADAAWLDLDPSHTGIDETNATQYYNLLPQQADTLRTGLLAHLPAEGDYVTNDLNQHPGFVGTSQAFRSLIQLPIRGLHNNYGTLYLIKVEPRTFAPEDLDILQTFTNQAVLSIENLELMRTSLENQRTQEELKIASQVQDSLIPKNLPTDNWFDISSHSLAAKEVGATSTTSCTCPAGGWP